MISNDSTILSQCDSSTSCSHNRDGGVATNNFTSLGQRYAMMATAELLGTRPADVLRVFKRGIGGNRIVDLYARIQGDILNLKPDVLGNLPPSTEFQTSR